MSVSDLYDEDFFRWTQSQAEALRAEARRQNRSNAIDWEHLAQEVGDLGKSDLRECLSRTRTIIEHLIKLAASGQQAPRAGWLVTVKIQRADLKPALTPTLRAKVAESLATLHADARDIAATAFAADEPGALPLDPAQVWSLEAILGEADDPIA